MSNYSRSKRKAFGKLSKNRPSRRKVESATSDYEDDAALNKYSSQRYDIDQDKAQDLPSKRKTLQKNRATQHVDDKENARAVSRKATEKTKASATKVSKIRAANISKKKSKNSMSRDAGNSTSARNDKIASKRWRPSLSTLQEVSDSESAILSRDDNDSAIVSVDLEKDIDLFFSSSEQHNALDINEEAETDKFISSMDISESSSEVESSGSKSSFDENSNSGCDDKCLDRLDTIEKNLPEGWIVKYSKSKNGRPFYINVKEQIKTWNPPFSCDSYEELISNSIKESKGREEQSITKSALSSYLKLGAQQASIGKRILKAPLCSFQLLDEIKQERRVPKHKVERKKKRIVLY